MFYTPKNKIPGLLMQIDFQKALDSVSWDFLYTVLQRFGVMITSLSGLNFLTMKQKYLRYNVDFLSNPIPIERGCRQGDPIAPYFFLLAAEDLGCLIENSPEITSIKIGNNMYKLTQFVDDTTIILDGTSKSLQATLNIFEIFGKISGLKKQ